MCYVFIENTENAQWEIEFWRDWWKSKDEIRKGKIIGFYGNHMKFTCYRFLPFNSVDNHVTGLLCHGIVRKLGLAELHAKRDF